MKPFGLLELPPDTRDFDLAKHFGAPSLPELPPEYIRNNPYEIKDQRGSLFCVGFAISECAEPHEGVILDEIYSTMKINQSIGGGGYSGTNLRQGMKAGLKGFLEKKDAPFTIDQAYDFIVDPKNWDLLKYDTLAAVHAQSSFFNITGPYDRFDNIRAALWQHREENNVVVTGMEWKASWSGSPDGVVIDNLELDEPYTLHAFVLLDWKLINGKPYIRAQLSNGEHFGAGGYFFFSREIVNRFADNGNYMYKDLTPEDIAKVKQLQWTLIQRLKEYITLLIQLAKKRGIIVAFAHAIGFPETG